MEIISYNIWDLPLWVVKNRKNRLLEVARILAEQHSDIICLQESWSFAHRKMLSEYLKKRGYHHSQLKGTNGGLVTFSKFPIISSQFIPFGRWTWSVSEVIGNKGVLETIIETPKGLLRILNMHLHYQSSKFINTHATRVKQLGGLFRDLRKRDTLPTILAGDFNEDNMLEKKSFAHLFEKEGFVHHQNGTELLPTYRIENEYVDTWLNRISHSQRYDYILTKDVEKIGLTVTGYTPWYINPPLSDHDPVLLTLR